MQLMDHQIADARFLAERKVAGCFNGMGTGKTLTALEAVKLVDAQQLVIVAPPIALQMWHDVSEQWLDTAATIITTGNTSLPDTGYGTIVMSYDIMLRKKDQIEKWVAGNKAVLICDESHALKSTVAKRTKAVLGMRGLLNSFDHTWLLTGTPMTRWPDDLIPFLFRAAPEIMKDRLGGLNIERFRNRFCVTQSKSYPGMFKEKIVVVGARNTDELGEILATCSTRRTLADVWDAMPDVTHTRLPVDLKTSPALTAALKALKSMSVDEVASGLTKQSDGDEDESLSTTRRLIGLGMVPEASRYIATIVDDTQAPLLVGAWHTEVIESLRADLAAKTIDDRPLRVETLTGATSGKRKTELQDAFNAGEIDVLVGQIGAMGVSLNLQKGGNYIVVVEEDWSPAIMDQFYARLHRMGQERTVHIDTLYADTKINAAVRRIAAAKRSADNRMRDAQQSV